MKTHPAQLNTISKALGIIKQYGYLDPKTLAERIIERLPNIRPETIENIKRAVIIAFKFHPIKINEILTEIHTLS